MLHLLKLETGARQMLPSNWLYLEITSRNYFRNCFSITFGLLKALLGLPLKNSSPRSLIAVIPDSLHFFVRIADQLIHQFVEELKHVDNIIKLISYDLHKMKRLLPVKTFLGQMEFIILHSMLIKILKFQSIVTLLVQTSTRFSKISSY